MGELIASSIFAMGESTGTSIMGEPIACSIMGEPIGSSILPEPMGSTISGMWEPILGTSIFGMGEPSIGSTMFHMGEPMQSISRSGMGEATIFASIRTHQNHPGHATRGHARSMDPPLEWGDPQDEAVHAARQGDHA